MKNANYKTKLIVLILLICTVMLMFSSCFLRAGGQGEREAVYYSHEEFLEFIKKYNSKNDGFVSTFISFDFDEIDIVGYKRYAWGMVANLKCFVDDPIYDKYQDDGMGINIIFYINDVDYNGVIIENAYQILCTYASNHVNYNYSQGELSMILYDNSLNQPHYFNYLKSDSLYNPNELEYHYIETYELKVNEDTVMQISVASLKESLSQDELDEICQLLLDNIVIINTEG